LPLCNGQIGLVTASGEQQRSNQQQAAHGLNFQDNGQL
jgi:hypothetical protein